MKMGTIIAILIAGLWPVASAQTSSTNTAAPSAQASASVAPAQTTAPPQRGQGGRSGRRNFKQPVTTDQQPTAHGPQQGRVRSQTSGPNDARTADHHASNTIERPAINYPQAVQRQQRERHDRGWWRQRYTTIVFVNGCGHYYWDAGYWFPAWGYDPQYENYAYNGPIYTYGNLLPDQVIYNVQAALKDLGYYSGPLNASISAATRNAITAFQEDNDLEVTAAIDGPTVEALGLY